MALAATTLERLRFDLADQLYSTHYPEAQELGTLANITASVWHPDATTVAAREAAASFIRRYRDYRPWNRSARFGLVLSALNGRVEFAKDRERWHTEVTGMSVEDYAPYFRGLEALAKALPKQTSDFPTAFVAMAPRAVRAQNTAELEALRDRLYTATPGSFYSHVLRVKTGDAEVIMLRHFNALTEKQLELVAA